MHKSVVLNNAFGLNTSHYAGIDTNSPDFEPTTLFEMALIIFLML